MNILTIEGGGVRGAFAASVLQTLCESVPKLFNRFDIIAGTSTGAIVASVIAVGKNPEEVTEIYLKHSKTIFSAAPLHAHGALRSKYDQLVLRRVMEQELGSVKLGDLKKRIIIPASNIITGQVQLFDSAMNSHKNLKLVDVVLASAAAPGYFDPVKVGGSLYADGGLWAVDPTASVVVQLLHEGVGPEEMNIISIGTGFTKQMYTVPKKGYSWGLLSGWKGAQLMNLFGALQNYYSVFILDRLANTARYFKVNVEVEKLADMDNPSVVEQYIELGKQEGKKSASIVKSILNRRTLSGWFKRRWRNLRKV